MLRALFLSLIFSLSSAYLQLLLSLPPRRGLPLLKFLPGLGHGNPCTSVYLFSTSSRPLVDPRSTTCRSFLGVLNFAFKIASFSKPQNPAFGAQKAPKKPSKPSPKPSQKGSKTALILQTPEIKNNATLPRFCSFLTFPGLAKSSQNRCQNGFKICVFLETLLDTKKHDFVC